MESYADKPGGSINILIGLTCVVTVLEFKYWVVHMKEAENRSSMTSWDTAEAQYLEGFWWDPRWLRGHLIQTLDSFLEQDNIDVVVDTLQKQFALEVDHLLLLGSLQGAHQRLEDICATVVIKQHPKLHTGLTVSIWNKKVTKVKFIL